MHDSFTVEFANSQNDLHCIKLNCVFLKAFLSLEHLIQLASLHKRHHEVQASLRLKQELHAHEERVICRKQNFLLQHRRLNLIRLNQHIFPDYFHGVLLPSRLQLAKIDLAESAATKLVQQCEVLECHVCFLLALDHD